MSDITLLVLAGRHYWETVAGAEEAGNPVASWPARAADIVLHGSRWGTARHRSRRRRFATRDGSRTLNEMDLALAAAERMFTDRIDDAAIRQARTGSWLTDAWAAIIEMGLTLALVDESSGGFGVDPIAASALVRLAGRFAVPLPLVETMAANVALAAAGLPIAEGVATLIPAHSGLRVNGSRLQGIAQRVPWGARADTLVVEWEATDGPRIGRLDSGWTVEEAGTNLAAMPRDTLRIDAAVTVSSTAAEPGLQSLGAAMRTLQIAGALDRVLSMTIAHVSEREQFGRSLSKFQVIQHELARLASETAAASAAADMAAEILTGAPLTALAAARVRSGEAVGIATGIAQQLHGAIGFTAEHRLHFSTTALWAWRDEFGGQSYWTALLGDAAFAQAGADFWHFVTKAA